MSLQKAPYSGLMFIVRLPTRKGKHPSLGKVQVPNLLLANK
jgi:hypothetical protein